MQQSTDLVINPNSTMIPVAPPSRVIVAAQAAATQLKELVSHKTKPVIINNEQYLEFEDWQTVGHFYGIHVQTGDAEPVDINGIKGAKARARAINDNGIVIGGAEAYCLSDEPNWQGKPWFQLASMAQTRAGSKALSNCLRWVVVLAGYRGTPAEEMTGREKLLADEIDVNSPLYCAEHKTMFFKRGKMTSYAHPIEGSDKWCHQHREAAPAAPSDQDFDSLQSASKQVDAKLIPVWTQVCQLTEKLGAQKGVADFLGKAGLTVKEWDGTKPPEMLTLRQAQGCVALLEREQAKRAKPANPR